MIAVALALALVLSCSLMALVLIGIAGRQRRDRLEVALEPTCLLCGSRSVQLGVPPEYRCTACGFDTRLAGTLTDELRRHAALSHAKAEVDDALRHLGVALATPADAAMDEPARLEHLAAAIVLIDSADVHLRGIGDGERLVQPPTPQLDETSVSQIAEYRDLIAGFRDDARADILAQLATDGAVAVQLDFEHVVEEDYR